MGIAFRSSSSGDVAAPGATTTISLPAGVQATDVVIAIFGSGRASTSSPNVVTPPTGWSAIAASITDNNGTDEVTLAGFWALGNVAALGFSNSQTASLNQGWVCLAFTGVDNTTPIDALGTNNSNSNSTSLTVNAVTVVTDQAWEIIGLADWTKQGGFNATGFTRVMNGTPPTNQGAACFYNSTPKSPGSTGTTVVSFAASGTNEILTAMPFALRPAVIVTTRPWPVLIAGLNVAIDTLN